MEVLVTGGAGFVGTNLIKRLLKDGYTVTSFDNYSTGFKENEQDGCKYYDIDMISKDFNIKMVYKVLAMLFKEIKSNKTVITITGKYGERGYSFTSDYYNKDNKYVLHLTDQYFVSHTSYNCTDIFQRGRIQGKYTDNPNLIFWTTSELVNTINEVLGTKKEYNIKANVDELYIVGANIDKTKKFLEYNPEISFKMGILKTINYDKFIRVSS